MYQNKKNRWNEWDYSNNGYYFITICTGDRYPYFGKIINNEMILNNIGCIVKNNFYETFKHYNYCYCDELIIMPNHIHIIIVIDYDFNVGVARNNNDLYKNNNVVGVARVRHLQKHKYIHQLKNNKNDRTKMYLSKIIHGFKSSVSREINKIKPYYFKWQKSFHDHVIRNGIECLKIKHYIINNPKMWNRDRNNKQK